MLIPYASLLIPIPIYDKSITEPDLDCDEISDSLDDDIDVDSVLNTLDDFPIDELESIDNGEEKEIKFYFNSVGSHWILLEVL